MLFRSSDAWEAYVAAGKSESALYHHQKASGYFEQANLLHFTDSVASMTLKACYEAQQFKKGVQLAKEYKGKLRSESPYFFKYTGLCEYETGASKDAEANLSEAIKALPSDFETSFYLSKVYLSKEQFEKAKKYADKATMICNSCTEIDIWNAILSFATTVAEDPHNMEEELKKDTSQIGRAHV